MTKYDVLDSMVEKGNGYLNTSDVLLNDISKTTLAGYVKERGMERVAHGMYLAQDAWRDELYQISQQNIRVYRVKKEFLELGAMDVETNFGNIVRAYDKERTICDILKQKDEMDVQVFRFAMREYMGMKDRNLRNLMKYAKIYGMEEKVRMYTEVMA